MGIERIDLQIAGARLRVLCEDAAGGHALRDALGEHLVNEEAEVGFLLRVPKGRTKLHLVLDRSGFVLARTKTADEGVAVVLRHLGAMLAPVEGTVRLRMRALLTDSGSAVLAGFPLLMSPTLVERRLERVGHRVVDRLVVDLTPGGAMRLAPDRWTSLASSVDVMGHATAPAESVAVTRTLVPSASSAQPTRAGLVAYFAGAVSPLMPRDERVAIAERLASGPIVSVPLGDRGALYAALSD